MNQQIKFVKIILIFLSSCVDPLNHSPSYCFFVLSLSLSPSPAAAHAYLSLVLFKHQLQSVKMDYITVETNQNKNEKYV